MGGACRNKHRALSNAELKHLSVINACPVDPPKAKLQIAECIPCQV